VLGLKVHSNQMPIAIKNSIIDISSEETTKELAKVLSNYLKGGEIIFYMEKWEWAKLPL
jgi:hypothetical protein